jgi:hypothetical protein
MLPEGKREAPATTLSGARAGSGVMHVLQRVTACGFVAGCARAGVADANDQDLGAHRPEVVQVLKVRLERVHELFLDVQHASAHLADSVVVVSAGELVMRRTIAKVGGVYRP